MVFDAPASGLLCPIALVSNPATTVFSGSAPLVTPSNAVPGLVMAVEAMLASLVPASTTPDTDTAGDG
jgi:hypothetical protein